MGRYIFRLPDIGEGIAEAEIVAWHIKVGDQIDEDAQLADMMTDKATVEMESPVAGKVIEIAGEVGETVAIGAALVVLEVEGKGNEADEAPSSAAAAEVSAAITEQEGGAVEEPEAHESQSEQAATAAAPGPLAKREPVPPAIATETGPRRSRILASPAVRKRADDLGVNLEEVRAAEDGRIRHADLDAFLSYNAAGGFQPAGRKGKDEHVRVIGLRRRIAENMAASKRNIPHFGYVEEYDVTGMEEARAQLNQARGDRPKLTILPILIAAICRLLPDFPMLNAHFDDEAGVVTRYGSVHLGVAVQTSSGLMVPVVRDAQDRNLWQMAAEIARLAAAARDGSIKSEELTGSTLTITSLGPMGGISTAPVINRPEVMILGPNRIVERPMFVQDGGGGERVEKRKLMNISYSCDHRVVDGWDAASFAGELKELIENPARILAG